MAPVASPSGRRRRRRPRPTSSKVPSCWLSEEEVAHGVVGDEEVDPAVAVDVDRHRRQRLATGTPVASFLIWTPASAETSVKRAVAVVAVEVGERALIVERRAVGAADAGEPVVELEVDRARPAHVVADEEVEVAVAVVVEERARRRPLLLVAADAGRRGDVGEARAGVLVAQQLVGADRGDEQVDVAVVVVVAGGDARAVEREIDARLAAHVAEAARAVVLVERERAARRAGGAFRPARRVDEEAGPGRRRRRSRGTRRRRPWSRAGASRRRRRCDGRTRCPTAAVDVGERDRGRHVASRGTAIGAPAVDGAIDRLGAHQPRDADAGQRPARRRRQRPPATSGTRGR